MNQKQNDKCPICGGNHIPTFLVREGVPVHQNLLMDSKKEANLITRGKLELSFCINCGFIFNKSFDPSKLNYSKQYNNNQSFSPSFQHYMNDLVDYIIRTKSEGEGDQNVVEVGCGKGDFLRLLIRSDEKIKGYGFDPSYEEQEGINESNQNITFYKDFYGPAYIDIPADIIVCRHVIEHINDPTDLLKTIRKTLINSPKARVFFETPNVEWILENYVIWDFFYEHCSYFTSGSLKTAFEKAGFKVDQVKNVFGGQYLWFEATINQDEIGITKNISRIETLIKNYGAAENLIFKKVFDKLLDLKKHGKFALWGAGAKGVTFGNLFDPKAKIIDCFVDVNPQKQGKYLPGTGHEIVNVMALKERNIHSILVLNPNYSIEIKQMLNERQIDINVIEMGLEI